MGSDGVETPSGAGAGSSNTSVLDVEKVQPSVDEHQLTILDSCDATKLSRVSIDLGSNHRESVTDRGVLTGRCGNFTSSLQASRALSTATLDLRCLLVLLM